MNPVPLFVVAVILMVLAVGSSHFSEDKPYEDFWEQFGMVALLLAIFLTGMAVGVIAR